MSFRSLVAKIRARPLRFTLTSALALLMLALGWHIGDVFIEDCNFRVVNADLYRAGQLRSDEWSESFEEHGYRSVLNLRGAGAGQAWYGLEREFAARHDLAHYDFRLSADRTPTIEQMKEVVALMRAAPKPLLIHCKEGADRSGLVAGLYLYAVENASPAQAGGQLSLRYGHFPWLTSRTGAMDRALADFIAADSQRRAAERDARAEVAAARG